MTRAALVGTIVGTVAGCCVALAWPRPAPPAIPRPVQRALDSLALTRARDSAVADSLRQVASRATARADSAARRARAVEARSRAAKVLADSLASEAARRDSGATDGASPWRAAYLARTAEADSLRAALAAQAAATALVRDSALAALRADLAATTARLRAVERVNQQLAQAAERVGRCTVLFIPCPTRGQAFVAGLVIGGAIVVAAR